MAKNRNMGNIINRIGKMPRNETDEENWLQLLDAPEIRSMQADERPFEVPLRKTGISVQLLGSRKHSSAKPTYIYGNVKGIKGPSQYKPDTYDHFFVFRLVLQSKSINLMNGEITYSFANTGASNRTKSSPCTRSHLSRQPNCYWESLSP